MEIVINRKKVVPPVELESFADAHGLVMVVNERDTRTPDLCFYASFAHAEVVKDGMRVSEYGDGPTPESAILAYMDRIQGGKRLSVRQTNGKYAEFITPETMTWLPRSAK